MKLTANGPLPMPPMSVAAANPTAARVPAAGFARATWQQTGAINSNREQDAGSASQPWSPAPPPAGWDRAAWAEDFGFARTLARGRIEGLQTALRLLAQPATTDAHAPDLPQLRAARLALCNRLQAQYAHFLGDPAAMPQGLPRTSRSSWRRSQLRQLLQEDLAWARSLPGDHQDLARAIQACMERIGPHMAL